MNSPTLVGTRHELAWAHKVQGRNFCWWTIAPDFLMPKHAAEIAHQHSNNRNKRRSKPTLLAEWLGRAAFKD